MGLIDTSQTEKLDHPHEQGQWVEIRPLLATEMDEATDTKIKRTLDLWGDSLDKFKPPAQTDSPVWGQVLERLNEVFKSVDLPESAERAVGQALAKLKRENAGEEEDTLAKRVAEYDWLTLLKYAVVNWSYPDGTEDPDERRFNGGRVSLEHIERLDAVTRDWLVEEVVIRNTRPLPSAKSLDGSSSWADAHENSSI